MSLTRSIASVLQASIGEISVQLQRGREKLWAETDSRHTHNGVLVALRPIVCVDLDIVVREVCRPVGGRFGGRILPNLEPQVNVGMGQDPGRAVIVVAPR